MSISANERIKNLVWSTFKGNLQDDFWFVSVVFLDAFENVDYTSAFFEHRGCAEKWFNTITENKSSYYGFCCDKNYWNNLDDLLNAVGDKNFIIEGR